MYGNIVRMTLKEKTESCVCFCLEFEMFSIVSLPLFSLCI